jgi:demethylmenaquinone methyltransferase/2-methoxy-6-polyprenyl-1,4-benzoquinol methylase
MLAIAQSKVSEKNISLPLIEGDALNLPFADGYFEVVTIGFGLRNLSSVEDGLKELRRVLKPGGQLAVLEFSKPGVPVLSWIFRFYFSRILPFLGGLLSGSRSAYEYLPDSVRRFPDQTQLAALMNDAGFTEVSFENLSGGIAALHFGRRAS